jgi:hypothetical protein
VDGREMPRIVKDEHVVPLQYPFQSFNHRAIA